jgi:heptosyltransferase I
MKATESHQALLTKGTPAPCLPGFSEAELAHVRQIGVFHLNALGDLLFSLPALVALRQRFPSAEITSIVRPHLVELLEPAQLADRIVTRPVARQRVEFLKTLRNAKFDLTVLFSQSMSASLYASLSGAKLRVGFADGLLNKLLSHKLARRGITCTEKLLCLTEWLGAQPPQRDYVGLLKVTEAQRQCAELLIRQNRLEDRRLAILSFAQGPGPIPLYKTWPSAHFVATGKQLLARGLTPVIIGARVDIPEAQAMADQIGCKAVSLAGRTRLGELTALIERAKVLIGIDSGPMHVAVALRVPTVALFGPTDPAVTGPQGDSNIVLRHVYPCSPCRKPVCDGRPCMSEISPDEVMQAVTQLLS